MNARSGVPLLVALLAVGTACQSDPFRQRAVTAELRVVRCAPGCPVPPPDSAAIIQANRGDSVLLFIEIRNALFDSVEVLLRGLCAENVAVLSGAGVVRQVPNPVTCPDSTFRRFVEPVLGNTEKRYYVWVVDSALTAGTYLLEERTLVDPRINPQVLFTVH